MREKFPHKDPGDRLTASHVNALSKVCRDIAAGGHGSHTNSFGGGFLGSSPGNISHMVQLAVIDRNTDTDGTYNVYHRYYDHDESEWKNDTDKGPYIMDDKAGTGVFADGTVVTAYWHEQRGAFIPLSTADTVLRVGKAEEMAPGSTSGVVRLWNDGEQTDDFVFDVYHDWITGDLTIAEGAEVIIGWFRDEGVWRVIGAECPPA